jgi:hypothetical protein
MRLRPTLLAVMGALAGGAVPTHSSGAEQPEMTLVCTNLASGAGWRIKIDFKTGTVDSNPAHISRSTISWLDARDGGHYTLDRKTGSLTVIFASSTGGYFLHDRCTPVTVH